MSGPTEEEFLAEARQILRDDYPVFEQAVKCGYLNGNDLGSAVVTAVPGIWDNWCSRFKKPNANFCVGLHDAKAFIEFPQPGITKAQIAQLEALGWYYSDYRNDELSCIYAQRTCPPDVVEKALQDALAVVRPSPSPTAPHSETAPSRNRYDVLMGDFDIELCDGILGCQNASSAT